MQTYSRARHTRNAPSEEVLLIAQEVLSCDDLRLKGEASVRRTTVSSNSHGIHTLRTTLTACMKDMKDWLVYTSGDLYFRLFSSQIAWPSSSSRSTSSSTSAPSASCFFLLLWSFFFLTSFLLDSFRCATGTYHNVTHDLMPVVCTAG